MGASKYSRAPLRKAIMSKIRIANNKTLYVFVLLFTALFTIGVVAAVGGIFYAASGGSVGWGIFGIAATVAIFAFPFVQSYREDGELCEYYDSTR